jgi:hypothetical protein
VPNDDNVPLLDYDYSQEGAAMKGQKQLGRKRRQETVADKINAALKSAKEVIRNLNAVFEAKKPVSSQQSPSQSPS